MKRLGRPFMQYTLKYRLGYSQSPCIPLGPCSRGLEHPATHDGGLLTDRDPGGTARPELEDTPLGNPDIRIPVTEMTTAHPWRQEDDAKKQEEEDDAGDLRRETDARGERKTESEVGETRE
ncbi:hypothetical protein NDU88_009341 [Pleurodeles waltl]|uniref:Uncharacterized protein n=1 Tax=Pleurodeles waltl TaxID=8319 RepID=A0AAV7PX01_PLEWA|nr:hypothetical protein NDU88_009341 [Pleurodeles waltl]